MAKTGKKSLVRINELLEGQHNHRTMSITPALIIIIIIIIIIHIIIIIIFLFQPTSANLIVYFPLKPIGICFLHHWPALPCFKSFVL